MRTAMLLVAVGQAAVTVAAARELLAGRRQPPGQHRSPRHLLGFIGVTAVLAAVAFAGCVPARRLRAASSRTRRRTGSPPGGGGVIVDLVP